MKNIIISAFFTLFSLCSCSKEEEKIIPGNTLSEILAEIYLVDQYMDEKPMSWQQKDTIAIYEAVFNKYGYTYTDYNNSLAHYLYRSDKLTKIYKNARTILENRRDEVQKEVNRIAERRVDWPTRGEVRGVDMKDLKDYPYLKSIKIIFEGIDPPEYNPNIKEFQEDSLSTSMLRYLFDEMNMSSK